MELKSCILESDRIGVLLCAAGDLRVLNVYAEKTVLFGKRNMIAMNNGGWVGGLRENSRRTTQAESYGAKVPNKRGNWNKYMVCEWF